jgi:anthranilate synthase/aminodeoxychorismate synthase-like glutamine amidotransferase
MILVVDNYDSFTFNLVQYLCELGAEVKVFRNDAIDVNGIDRLHPSALLFSPGPCTPNEAGISVAAIRLFSGKVPILGVCLGHQAIAHAFGATVGRASRPMHGKSSTIAHDGTGVFRGVDPHMRVGRYHSLAIQKNTVPPSLRVTAVAEDDGEIMAVEHREHRTVGVQFHPESVLTPQGKTLLANFLEDASC